MNTQKPSTQPRETSETEVAPRQLANKPVSLAVDNHVVSTSGASADTVAAVTEMVTPLAPTNTIPTPLPGMKTMIKITEDYVALGQANLEAFIRSSQIWAAGVQELMKQFATTTKASFDESVATFKAISTTKSVSEAIDLQSKFATNVVENSLAEANNLIHTSINLTEQTLAPITARVTTAFETFGKTV